MQKKKLEQTEKSKARLEAEAEIAKKQEVKKSEKTETKSDTPKATTKKTTKKEKKATVKDNIKDDSAKKKITELTAKAVHYTKKLHALRLKRKTDKDNEELKTLIKYVSKLILYYRNAKNELIVEQLKKHADKELLQRFESHRETSHADSEYIKKEMKDELQEKKLEAIN